MNTHKLKVKWVHKDEDVIILKTATVFPASIPAYDIDNLRWQMVEMLLHVRGPAKIKEMKKSWGTEAMALMSKHQDGMAN